MAQTNRWGRPASIGDQVRTNAGRVGIAEKFDTIWCQIRYDDGSKSIEQSRTLKKVD